MTSTNNSDYPKYIKNLYFLSNLNSNIEDISKEDVIDSINHLNQKEETDDQVYQNIKRLKLKEIINKPPETIGNMPPIELKSRINPNLLTNLVNLSVFQNVPSTDNLFSNYIYKKDDLLYNMNKQLNSENNYNNINNPKQKIISKNYQPQKLKQTKIPPFSNFCSGSTFMNSNTMYLKKNNDNQENNEEENDGKLNYRNSIYDINKKKNNKKKKNYDDEEEVDQIDEDNNYFKKKKKNNKKKKNFDEEEEDYDNQDTNNQQYIGFKSAITISNAVFKNKISSDYVDKVNNKNNDKENQDDNTEEIQTKRTFKKFVPPRRINDPDNTKNNKNVNDEKSKVLDEKLKGFDEKMIEFIESEILSNSPNISWDDIAGLEFAKKTIKEIIIWPLLRPDIFNGIRRPPKGLLLFGPPGTGKTMIAKAIASQSHSHFFNISASSLMSKWVGESEKLVRTLFALASYYQPSVVFIDEIDSILTSRSENECESSRRIKTEFLVQLDGAGTNADDRILIIGATNRPQEIDDAFIRRLSKRLYIPLPNKASRKQLINNVLNKEKEKNNKYDLSEEDINFIVNLTKGYSGSDLINVCREAAMMPIRCIEDINNVQLDNLRGINKEDFINSINFVKPSINEKSIDQYIQWNKDFGSFQFEEKDE